MLYVSLPDGKISCFGDFEHITSQLKPRFKLSTDVSRLEFTLAISGICPN